MNWFLICFLMVVGTILLSLLLRSTVHDFVEGRGGVKFVLLYELWLRSGEEYSSGGSAASRCVRNVTRIRESTSTGTGLAGEDFQNTGTFIVARSTVFAVSIAHKTHHARDAHNALWNSRRPGQVRKYSLASRGNWLFEDSRMCQ